MDEEHFPMPENHNDATAETATASIEFTEPAAPAAEAAPAPAETPEAAPAEAPAKVEEAPAAPAAKAEDDEEEGIKFADLGIDGRVLAALQDVGYEKPSWVLWGDVLASRVRECGVLVWSGKTASPTRFLAGESPESRTVSRAMTLGTTTGV
jgi:pyruvate/2-oxoglutarate dehydrogenase complex dihydrolipoamide acyltransferase (E2) component